MHHTYLKFPKTTLQKYPDSALKTLIFLISGQINSDICSPVKPVELKSYITFKIFYKNF